METIKTASKKLCQSRSFEGFIILVILVNSALIGVEVSHHSTTISLVQQIILYIFTFEIAARAIAADSAKSFMADGWNIFDLSLVTIGWIPDNILGGGSGLMLLRVLRVFRVLRLLRTAKELKLIVSVLIKSMKSIFYNALLFMIFVYLYAIAGVYLFRLPDPAGLTGSELTNYQELMQTAPNAPANAPDPFGSIGEAFFTLFRALTGEDWTDLRYNLITASDLGVINVGHLIVTAYFVSWFCIAAFLLLNLVTGAVINNYQNAITEAEENKKAAAGAEPVKEPDPDIEGSTLNPEPD